MILLAKVSVVVAVLLIFYKLFLEKESFFAVNRIYLLVGLVLSFVLPFVALPELVENQGLVNTWLAETVAVSVENPSEEIRGIDFEEVENSIAVADTPEVITEEPLAQPRGFIFWLKLLYFFGVLVFLASFLWQLLKMMLHIFKSKDRITTNEYVIINDEEGSGPCSFFNYIFIDPKKYEFDTYEQIVAHEKIHVKKKHSIDFLIAELAIIVLWFNPFVWLFRKAVEKNCEYQTDAILLNTKTVEPENYQLSLLEIATERKPLTLVSNYNQSLIKKRIIMMNKKKSNKQSYWKYAFIAPTLFITLLLLNRPMALTAQESQVVFIDNEDLENEEYGGEYENDHSDDLPPLLRAAADGDIEKVKMLVEQGVDVNTFAHGDGTALFLAIQHSHIEVAELLLQNGADPNLGSRSDGYPLLAAIADGDIDLVKFIIKKGADVNRAYLGDGSALILASKMGHLEMVKVLVGAKANINMPVEGDGNPLIMASKAGQLHVVKYLVDLGADVNYEVVGDETPLISSSEQGHLETVKFLIAAGANVNKVCEEMHRGKIRVRTALKMAKQNKHNEVVDYLKANGAKN